MAQRIIHYLLGDRIADQMKWCDKERFLLGSIMPDAAEVCDRDKAHFKIKTDQQVYYDFEMFRNSYPKQMLQDDLYLGYYLHLVEDAFYRAFLYQDRFRMPRTQEEVNLLHHDYRILNSYIVQRYGIRNILQNDTPFMDEPITGIAAFQMRKCLDEMALEFSEQTKGITVFLTETLLDEFVETCLSIALKEIRSLQNGTSSLHASDYAWPRKR